VSLAPYAKAIAAFVSTAAAGVVASLLLGSDGGTQITVNEWIGVVSTTILATLAVFSVPNKPDTSEPPLVD
jgi:hypothetical protein